MFLFHYLQRITKKHIFTTDHPLLQENSKWQIAQTSEPSLLSSSSAQSSPKHIVFQIVTASHHEEKAVRPRFDASSTKLSPAFRLASVPCILHTPLPPFPPPHPRRPLPGEHFRVSQGETLRPGGVRQGNRSHNLRPAAA